MTNIVVFRDKNEARGLGGIPASLHRTGACVIPFQPRAQRQSPVFVLRASWRRDAGSGRLECRWLRERDAGGDGDASIPPGSAAGRGGVIASRRLSALFG